MKNKFIYLVLLSIFAFNQLFAENLNIQSLNISIDKKTKLTIFKGEVVAIDEKNNIFKTEYAEYKKSLKLLESKDKTNILTSQGYNILGTNMIFDNENNYISSKYPATVTDLDNNNIYVENFEYSTEKFFFKSSGKIKVVDNKNNSYNFSQVYIDEIKKEILGTDTKSFLNQNSFKINNANKPRIFANTVKIDKEKSMFTKSVFSLCDYREDDKCPPWSLQASEMVHDKIKKTIYYDNAVIKIYDIPIFFTPFLSHPDPSVDRRSGLLTPSFSDSKNLGTGFSIPYFWALNKDKDFTFTSKLFAAEHPLFLGEYRKAFKSSNIIFDLGYTEGYKNTNNIKKSGNKSHFFSKFVKNFKGKNNSDNNLEFSLQEVSNDKYFKLYKVKSSLVDYQIDTLESNFSFNHENDNLFLGINASIYETLKDDYNDKYEYVLPDITLDKNLFANENYGSLDYQSNFNIHNYDTNKSEKFLVNNFDWQLKNKGILSNLSGDLLGKIKNVNYEAKNVDKYKKDSTSEVFGAIGYLAKLNLIKNGKNNSNHYLTPKILFRYAPDHMRKENDGARLNGLNIFSLDRLDSYNNLESGLSSTLGFDYKTKNINKEFDFSLGQIINEKENKNMPSSSSLDEKLSDVIGASNLKVNDNINFKYNFALDQNYDDFNYNDVGTSLNINQIQFDFNFLQEKKHIGDQEYIKSNIKIAKGQNGVFSFGNKRNLITHSSEFYNLSYEYLNDCLRAGLVYRREFYQDSELEAEDSLMFKITLTPFGNINSPSLN